MNANCKENIIYDSESFDYWEENDRWFQDEMKNCDKQYNECLVCIADIGRWNGRVGGYKVLGNNLNNVLTCVSGGDGVKVYFDGKNVKAVQYHHDGQNYLLFRKMRPGRDFDKFMDILFNRSPSKAELAYYTESVGPDVAKIYGWKCSERSRKRAKAA